MSTAGPYVGIKVLDFGQVMAAPYAGMILADLGADVVKIESPSGDATRNYTPPDVGGESPYYLFVNRNKRGIAIDLKSEDGHYGSNGSGLRGSAGTKSAFDLRCSFRIRAQRSVLEQSWL